MSCPGRSCGAEDGALRLLGASKLLGGPKAAGRQALAASTCSSNAQRGAHFTCAGYKRLVAVKRSIQRLTVAAGAYVPLRSLWQCLPLAVAGERLPAAVQLRGALTREAAAILLLWSRCLGPPPKPYLCGSIPPLPQGCHPPPPTSSSWGWAPSCR